MKHSRHTRPNAKLNSQMNVVPYIDVMLVLLIIFMAITPIVTTGVSISLPKERTQNIAIDHSLPVIVALDAQGDLYLSYENHLDQAIDEPSLTAQLSTLTKTNPDLQVLVNADGSNNYKALMHLLALLQQLGVQKIALVAQEPPKKP